MDQRATPHGGHAVVLGGSMAGLLAARVLADRFARVTLVERDRLARDGEPRKGVPQGRHVHVLLARGQQALARLFPGLELAPDGLGAVPADTGSGLRWHHFGGWKARFESGIPILFVYRPALESRVARQVLGLPGVEAIEGCEARGLAASSDRRRITGVVLARAGGSEEVLAADLVVDASGRGSQTPRWLEGLGFQRPEETSVEVDVGYSSRIYAHAENGDGQPGWTGLFLIPRPPLTRAAAIFPIGGDRWLVTLAGWLADYPPLDEDGYREFARSLPVPDVARALEGARPLTPIVPHRFPSNLRRRYEKLARFPAGLVVLGDALCSFNPVYGQGMTVAAQHVEVLAGCLAGNGQGRKADLDRACSDFCRRAAKVTDVPWQLATGEDFRYPGAIGRRPPGTGFLNWYVGRVHEAAMRDPRVTQSFYRVLHLLAPPALLLRPDVAVRALRPRAR